MNATQITDYSPRSAETLKAIVVSLSHGHPSHIDKICDAIMQDLEKLCLYAKGHGSIKTQAAFQDYLVMVTYRPLGQFEGTYVGFRLADNWLKLGFLEEEVAARLIKKLAQHCIIDQAEPNGRTIQTAKGSYQILKTDAWSIMRKVD